jgi:predicted nuclease with RNAse H fold
VAVGIDLAGSPLRTTGFCQLDRSGLAQLVPLHRDEEILERTRAAHPAIVSIDAPLSLPRGRRTIEDRSGPHLRACDRALLERKIRFFPITLGPMRMHTTRGLRLQAVLVSEGFRVIESYPGGAQDVLGIPRKGAGIAPLRRGLQTLGLRGDITRRNVTHDELDAATSAYVGLAVLAGRGEALGDPSEGLLYLPRPKRLSASDRRRAAPR